MASVLTIPGLPASTRTKPSHSGRRRSGRSKRNSSTKEPWPSLVEWTRREQADERQQLFSGWGFCRRKFPAAVFGRRRCSRCSGRERLQSSPQSVLRASCSGATLNWRGSWVLPFLDQINRLPSLRSNFSTRCRSGPSPGRSYHRRDRHDVCRQIWRDGVLPYAGRGPGRLPSLRKSVREGHGVHALFKHNDPNDFAHSHGAVHFDDCLSEAVFGEVNENLFARGASRVVAIIDQGKDVVAPGGRRIPVALVVRTGSQLRPAHLLAAHIWPQRSLAGSVCEHCPGHRTARYAQGQAVAE